ncbi:hypothetical protein ALC57_07829 [Trachymyrmex cornetzi]|uniref:Uncharacterized protein n=1 Tax=Trachymyrmex cornetzi TaxID=471704 RepID=A0A195E4K0_9HYME|nr:hypothetical protein ALC57_07829 [Trachymyrmex cornetzi]
MNFPSGSYLVPRILLVVSCRLGISLVFLSRRIYTSGRRTASRMQVEKERRKTGRDEETKRDGEGRKGYVTREPHANSNDTGQSGSCVLEYHIVNRIYARNRFVVCERYLFCTCACPMRWIDRRIEGTDISCDITIEIRLGGAR